MIPFKEQTRTANVSIASWTAACTMVAVCLLVPPVAGAMPDIIPTQITDVAMGAPSSAVIDRINAVGTHSTESLPLEGRKRVVWLLPKSRHYKNVMFYFTEKDRLFLIRFTLDDVTRGESPTLKKAFFDKFDFSWDRPSRLRIKEDDAVLYGSENNDRVYFLECTDRNTRERAFELFDRVVSSEDRPVKRGEKPRESTEGEIPVVPPAPSDGQPAIGPAPPTAETPAALPPQPPTPAIAPKENQ